MQTAAIEVPQFYLVVSDRNDGTDPQVHMYRGHYQMFTKPNFAKGAAKAASNFFRDRTFYVMKWSGTEWEAVDSFTAK